MWLRVAGAIAWRWIAFFIGWAILLGLAMLLLATRLESLRQEAPLTAQFLADALSAVTILAASWAMVRLAERRELASIGLGLQSAGADGLIGLGLGVAWLGTSLAPLALTGLLTVVARVGSVRALGLAAIAVALNVLTQELLVHGYLFRVIQWRAGGWVALLLTSVLFAGLHAPAFQGSWLPAINVFLAGAALGMACWRTGQLWLATGIHFAWNFGLGPLAGLTLSGRNPYDAGWRLLALKESGLWSGGGFGIEGSLVVTFTAVGLLFLFIRWPQRGQSCVTNVRNASPPSSR